MEIRPIKKEEYAAAQILMAHAFFMPYNYLQESKDAEAEQSDQWRIIRGAFEGDTLQACTTLLPMDAWYEGKVVGFGAVQGVACLPEYRRGGRIRALMLSVLEEMYERGDVFSFLYPFSYMFYRKFGYEVNQRLLRTKAPLADLLRWERPGHARQFLPECIGGESDPMDIVEVYNLWAARQNLSVDRDGSLWRRHLEKSPTSGDSIRTYVWYSPKDVACAYIQFSRKDHSLIVQDFAWSNKEGLYGMLGFMGRLGGSNSLQHIQWDMAEDIAPELFWPETHDLETEQIYHGMARVIHVERALGLLHAPTGSADVTIEVSDEQLPVNTGIYRVCWSDGSLSVKRTQSPANLRVSIPALTQMLSGFLPFAQIALREDVTLFENGSAFAALFPKRSCSTRDYF